MADKKISQLTAASTPLDGTEVLPIVQSGSTVKVQNNDLRPKQIQSNATSGVLQVVGPAAAATRVMTTPDANFTVARTDAAQTFSGDQTINNLKVSGNTISSVDSNGNIILDPNGNGRVLLDTTTTPTLNLVAAGSAGLKVSNGGFYTFTQSVPASTTKTINIAAGGSGNGSMMIMVGGRVAGFAGTANAMYFAGGIIGDYKVATISKTNSGDLILGDATVSGSTVSFTAQNTNSSTAGDITVAVLWGSFTGGELTITVT